VKEVGLIPDEGAVEQFVAEVWIQRSIMEFMRGIRTPLSTVSIPASARMASNRDGYLPSWSRMR